MVEICSTYFTAATTKIISRRTSTDLIFTGKMKRTKNQKPTQQVRDQSILVYLADQLGLDVYNESGRIFCSTLYSLQNANPGNGVSKWSWKIDRKKETMQKLMAKEEDGHKRWFILTNMVSDALNVLGHSDEIVDWYLCRTRNHATGMTEMKRQSLPAVSGESSQQVTPQQVTHEAAFNVDIESIDSLATLIASKLHVSLEKQITNRAMVPSRIVAVNFELVIPPSSTFYDEPNDIEIAMAPLEEVSNLSLVSLEGNTYSTECVKLICDRISKFRNIETVNFSDIFTSRSADSIFASVECIAQVLSQQNLRDFDISENALGSNGILFLVPIIAQSTGIRYLNLDNTGIGRKGAVLLAAAIHGLATNLKCRSLNSSLEKLVCGRSRLEDIGMQELGVALARHSSLKSLDLRQNGIKPDGLSKVLAGITLCPIRNLDISDNLLKTESSKVDISVLEGCLRAWKSLVYLNLAACFIDTELAFDIVNALVESNSPIEILDLSNNNIDDTHGLNLVAKTGIKSLILYGNDIDFVAIKQVLRDVDIVFQDPDDENEL